MKNTRYNPRLHADETLDDLASSGRRRFCFAAPTRHVSRVSRKPLCGAPIALLDMLRLFLLLGLLFVLSGCSLFQGDEHAEVQFAISRSGLLAENTLALRARDGERTLTISNTDFGPKEQITTGYATPAYETATQGALEVAFDLRTQSGQPISAGRFAVDLRKDWRWSVILWADSAEANPTEGCFGCSGYHAFAIDQSLLDDSAAGKDSVYVVLGGNYISEPVIY